MKGIFRLKIIEEAESGGGARPVTVRGGRRGRSRGGAWRRRGLSSGGGVGGEGGATVNAARGRGRSLSAAGAWRRLDRSLDWALDQALDRG